jgi:hypothetical protein
LQTNLPKDQPIIDPDITLSRLIVAIRRGRASG